MSFRVVREGTVRILKVSDKDFPPGWSRKANGIWYKLRSGTMMIPGSVRRLAIGAMISFWSFCTSQICFTFIM